MSTRYKYGKMLAIRVESGSDDPDNLGKLGYSLVATGSSGSHPKLGVTWIAISHVL